MTFRLDLANRAKLFKNYASWYEDNNIIDKSHVSFTFSLCYLINSIENIHKHKLECLAQYELLKDKLGSNASEICFQSPSLFNLFSDVSITLNQIRIVQNNLLELIGKNLKKSFPASMNDYVKKSKNRKRCDIEEKIFVMVEGYWNKNGLKVKQYRDVDQHYGQMLQNAVLVKNGESPNIQLRLPDNPKEQSWKRFTFDKKIDAISFVQDSFMQLHDLVNKISILLGYSTERVFDLNIATNDEFSDYLTIVFDPFKNLIVGQEIFNQNEEKKFMTHIEECDLSKFSFIKVPEYFDCNKLPEQHYVTGKVFNLDNG
jgi:hypothetical protein